MVDSPSKDRQPSAGPDSSYAPLNTKTVPQPCPLLSPVNSDGTGPVDAKAMTAVNVDGTTPASATPGTSTPATTPTAKTPRGPGGYAGDGVADGPFATQLLNRDIEGLRGLALLISTNLENTNETLQKCADLIPHVWQHRAILSSTIGWKGQLYHSHTAVTADQANSKTSARRDIVINDTVQGHIEVVYCPIIEAGEPNGFRPGQFFLDALADHLGTLLTCRNDPQCLWQTALRYQLFSEMTSDYIYSALLLPDGSAEPEWITGAVERITGYTFDDIRRHPRGWFGIAFSEAWEQFQAMVPALRAGQPVVYEYRILTQTGERRWLRDHITPIWNDKAHTITRILGAVQDITAQKLAEEELKSANLDLKTHQHNLKQLYHEIAENEQRISQINTRLSHEVRDRKLAEQRIRHSHDRIELLLQTIRLAVAETYPSGYVSYANAAFTKLLGLQDNELLPVSLFELPETEADRERLAEAIQITRKGLCSTDPFTTSVLRQDGKRIHIQMDWAPKLNDEGECTGFIVVITDITAARYAQEALRSSEEKFQKAFLASPQIMGISLRADGRFIEINDAFTRILGYPREQVVGHTSGELGLFANPEQREALLERLDRGEQVRDAEVELRSNKGQLLTMQMGVEPIELSGSECLLVTAIDVTQRKQAERAYQQAQAKYREIFEGSRDGFVMVDAKGRFIDANPAYCEMLGYTNDELDQLENFYTLTPEKWHDWEREEIWDKRLLAWGYSGIYEKEYIRKDGTVFPVELQSYCVFDDKGEPEYLWGIARDITERKKAEATLQDASLSRDEAIRGGNVGLWDWDLRSNKVRYSREWKAQIGYSEDEISNDFSEWERRVHPDDLAPTIAAIQDYIDNQSPSYEVSFRFRHKDGNYRWILARASVINNAAGEPIRVLGSHTDITEQKRAEQVLRESENQFRTLFNASPDAHVIYTAEGYLDCNQATVKLLGLGSKDELLHAHPADISPPTQPDGRDSAEKARDMIQIAYDNGSHLFEWVCQRKDGTIVHLDVLLNVISLKGKTAIHSVWRDITERKQAEAALRESWRHEERLALCSHTLLEGDDSQLPEALRHLMIAANVGRVYLFENVHDPDDGLCMRQTHEVTAEGVTPYIDEPTLQHRPYQAGGFARWMETLSANEPIGGMVETFPPAERAILEPQGILSILIIPLTVNGQWYGFIGFDELVHKRQWSNEEVRLLRVGADMIGNFLQRQQAERALRDSEADLARAQAIGHLGSWSYNVERDELKWSDEMYRLLGFIPGDPPQPTLALAFSHVHQDDRLWLQQQMETTLADPTQTSIVEEFRTIPIDGHPRILRMEARIERDAQGRAIQFFGVDIDMTERKEAEQALRESEEQHRRLHETMTQGAVYQDSQGQITSANPAAEEILGVTVEEMLQRTSHSPQWQLTDEHGRPLQGDEHPTMVALHTGRHLHNKIISVYNPRKQAYRWLRIDAIPLFEPGHHHPIRVYSIFEDITERKQAVEAMQERERRFRAIFETSIDGIILMDMDGTVVMANKAACEMYDYDEDEFMGLNATDLIHSDYQQLFHETQQQLDTKKIVTCESVDIRKDGTCFDVEVRVRQLSYMNQPRMVMMVRDITQQKKHEARARRANEELMKSERALRKANQQLEANQQKLKTANSRLMDSRHKLQISNDELRSLASELSLAEDRERQRIATVLHDQVGQSLVLAKMKVDACLREQPEQSPAQLSLQQVSDLIKQGIYDTRTLTYDIGAPVLHQVGLEAAIGELLSELFVDKATHYTLVDDDKEKPLESDIMVLLYQATRELLVNVIKHARADHVTVTLRRCGVGITVEVNDDGKGFDPKSKPFKPNKKGGFGLFSVRERLGYLGGDITIDSAPGQGTTVTLTAPIDLTQLLTTKQENSQ